MIDDDLYCITSNVFSCAIWKDINNEQLNKIIETIKTNVKNNTISRARINFNDLIIDTELKNRIKYD